MTPDSPLHFLPQLTKFLGVEVSIKRDDLLPFFLGGNKVRKNQYIFKEILNGKKKVHGVITNGGAESNHARVCALMAKSLGLECHLVLHGQPANSNFLNGNEFFINAADAHVEYVIPEFISDSIDRIKRSYNGDGKVFEVIPGGGHSLTGAKSYLDAVYELEEEPDYIVLASGTGATQAGIQAGVNLRGWKTKVIGISVAREAKRGKKAIEEIYIPLVTSFSNLPVERCDDIILNDDYRFGGYAKYTDDTVSKLKEIISLTGVPFDPVYTGKAMIGLIDLVRKGVVQSNSKVLFWHTGGLLNLQSSIK